MRKVLLAFAVVLFLLVAAPTQVDAGCGIFRAFKSPVRAVAKVRPLKTVWRAKMRLKSRMFRGRAYRQEYQQQQFYGQDACR